VITHQRNRRAWGFIIIVADILTRILAISGGGGGGGGVELVLGEVELFGGGGGASPVRAR
jgi:hypothetical protein